MSFGRSVAEICRGRSGRGNVEDGSFDDDDEGWERGAGPDFVSLIDSAVKAFSSSSPPPDVAQNFMYRSTIFV